MAGVSHTHHVRLVSSAEHPYRYCEHEGAKLLLIQGGGAVEQGGTPFFQLLGHSTLQDFCLGLSRGQLEL